MNAYRGLAELLRVAFAAGRRAFIGLVVIGVSRYVLAALVPLGLSVMMSGLTSQVPRIAWAGGLLTVALAALPNFLGGPELAFAAGVRERASARIDETLTRAVTGAPLISHFEDPKFVQMLQLIRMYRGNLAAVPEVFVSGVGLVAQIGIAVGLLVRIHPLLIVIPIVGLVTVWSGLRNQAELNAFMEQTASIVHRREALLGCTLSAAACREGALFGWPHLHGRIASDARLLLGWRDRVARNAAGRSALAWFVAVIPFAGGLLLAANSRDPAVRIANVTMLLVIAGQLNAQLSGAASMGQLLRELRFVGEKYFNLIGYVGFEGATEQRPVPAVTVGEQGAELVQVTFKYPTRDINALSDLTVNLTPGQVIALVGENGSGKSTFIKLLCSMYEPTSGELNFPLGREFVASVEDKQRSCRAWFQDCAKFRLVARESIGIGDLAANFDDERILSAARAAECQTLITRLPHGLDTQLGAMFMEGVELSEGEWQRVALARALMRRAPIFVLDEPSSALDPFAERQLFANMSQLLASASGEDGITVLATHRLWSARMADVIIVLQEGRLVGVGSHQHLMGTCEYYRTMYAMQRSLYQTPSTYTDD